MSYVQGFVIPVPTDRKEDYRKMAADVAPFFMEYGAIRLVECWGDTVPEGKKTDFRRAVDLQDGETVVFSWIEWPDKASADACEKAMETDKRFAEPPKDMPMDGSRMIWGGFEPFFEAAG